ncbi:MAG: iron-containing redox enzyme family protein [Candidatus Peribacteraceae bacterium]|nr:iron-containing redox enzyme family protein [Candidatus Peribacteraceae bacterium]
MAIQKVGDLKEEVRRLLPNPASLEPARLRAIVRTYGLFADKFVPWLTIVHDAQPPGAGRDACRDNLLCEIEEDHPRLLREFLAQIEVGERDITRIESHVARCQPWITAIDAHCRQPVPGLALITGLEHASLAFVPWLKEVANMLRLGQVRYLETHGEADIAHARELEQALAKSGGGDEVFLAFGLVHALLRDIFTGA